MGDTMEVGLIL